MLSIPSAMVSGAGVVGDGVLASVAVFMTANLTFTEGYFQMTLAAKLVDARSEGG
jgi:hypothetical protein